MAGVLLASTLVGQLISRTGKWKGYMVAGSFIMLAGLVMMGQLRYDTSFWFVGVAMFVLGAGVGMCMQNLVLVVQNTVSPNELGVSSSAVTFFRTIGGTAGMSAMGAMLSHQVVAFITEGLDRLAKTNPEALAGADKLAGGTIPKIAELTAPIRDVVESAYGHGIGDVFLAASPVAIVAIVAIMLIPNLPLSTKSAAQQRAELDREASDAEVASAQTR
jgi:MFS family permease